MTSRTPSQNSRVNSSRFNRSVAAAVATVVFAVALLFAWLLFGETRWVPAVAGALFVVSALAWLYESRQSLRTRGAAYGLNSILTTVLVLGILIVGNFLANRYPKKWDLTRNQLHTLSDQTRQLVRGLKEPLRATFFGGSEEKQKVRPLLENLKDLNPKFEVEYTDPRKDLVRAKRLGIDKMGTLSLEYGARTQKLDDVTEEKLTGALVKLTKSKSQTLCAITGHGEKSFDGNDGEAYSVVKAELTQQGYETRALNWSQDPKIPETCDALALIGPKKPLFPFEVKLLTDYLAGGGRALLALDLDPRTNLSGQELAPLLTSWHLSVPAALVIDLTLKRFGGNPATPIAGSWSQDSPITKEIQETALFPLARPVVVIPGAPAGLNAQWLVKTSPNSWSEDNLKAIASGQIEVNRDPKRAGPHAMAASVEGKLKDSKAPRATRLVVIGTSNLAANQFVREAANLDFFVNATSWVLEDDTQITIRKKDDDSGVIELTERTGTLIGLVTVFLLPFLIFVAGLASWWVRRKR